MSRTGGLLPAAPRGPAAPERPDGLALLTVTALGLVIRLSWALAHRRSPLSGDSLYYHYGANLVADGKGFVAPIPALLSGHYIADAAHPPLYELYLSLWSLAGATSKFWHLLASVLAGTCSVFVLARVGRLLGGRRAGVLAGFLAAVAPNLWLWDGLIAAETIAILMVSLFLLAVVRYLDAPSWQRLAAVAAAATLAGLARAELILLVLVVVPLAWRTSGIDSRARLAWLAASGVVAAALLAPWAIYNQTRFEQPVVMSTGLGLVLASSECDSTWYGPAIGYWSFGCSIAGGNAGGVSDPISTPSGDRELDGSEVDGRLRRVALRYVGDHPSRLPAVIGARLGRVTGLYRPIQQASLQDTNEGAPRWVAGAIMSTWYVFAGLAIVGGLALRRGGVPLIALTSPLLVVLVTTVLAYGIGRFRAPAEPAVVVFAAVGVDAFVRRRFEGTAPPDRHGLLARFAAASSQGPGSPASEPGQPSQASAEPASAG